VVRPENPFSFSHVLCSACVTERFCFSLCQHIGTNQILQSASHAVEFTLPNIHHLTGKRLRSQTTLSAAVCSRRNSIKDMNIWKLWISLWLLRNLELDLRLVPLDAGRPWGAVTLRSCEQGCEYLYVFIDWIWCNLFTHKRTFEQANPK
jgi:hypothetical protein